MSNETEYFDVAGFVISGKRDEEKLRKNISKIDKLTKDMFNINMLNVNERAFMKEVLDDFGDKFDTESDAAANWLFETAAKVGSKTVIKKMLSDKLGVEMIPSLAEAEDDVFKLLKSIESAATDDIIVNVIAKTAVQDEAKERLALLKKWGYDFKLKNSSGKTAVDILREESSKKADKGKRGVSNKGNISRGINLIDATEKGENKTESPIGNIICIAIVVAIVAAVVVAFTYGKSQDKKTKKNNETTVVNSDDLTNSDDTSASSEKTLSTDENREVEYGDVVNIDYVGSIDGVEFSGGNTEGMGTDLEIGSYTYIDNFEDQLVGHKIGETVDVYATFPEDYGVDELNGKEALFVVTINGIYE